MTKIDIKKRISECSELSQQMERIEFCLLEHLHFPPNIGHHTRLLKRCLGQQKTFYWSLLDLIKRPADQLADPVKVFKRKK